MSVAPAHSKAAKSKHTADRTTGAPSAGGQKGRRSHRSQSTAVVSTREAISQAYADLINELAQSNASNLLAPEKTAIESTTIRNNVNQKSQRASSTQATAAVDQTPARATPATSPSASDSTTTRARVTRNESVASDNKQDDKSTTSSTHEPSPVICETATSSTKDSQQRYDDRLHRRLKLARDQFYESNPHACAASRAIANRATLPEDAAPDDLLRPFATLKKHYDSRRHVDDDWIPDAQDFCRTYQRLLPPGWASRIVDCSVSTASQPSRAHAVLFVWRDETQGLWVVDLSAARIRGQDAEADYQDWEVTPQHFATLVKPQRTHTWWPGIRKVFKRFSHAAPRDNDASHSSGDVPS